MSDAWEPEQYARFQRERQAPFYDLLDLARPQVRPEVVDLGCGTGELTAVLHDRLAAARTVGVDSSQAMLKQAQGHATDRLSFEPGDLAAYARAHPGGFDVVLSNAAVHWVDDHARLFGDLAAMLRASGQLLVQMPCNDDHPSHLVAREVAAQLPFAAVVGEGRRSPVLAPEAYAALLYDLGFASQEVRLRVYLHLLPSRGDVIEWVRGTTLTYYKERLSPELYADFLAAYRQRLFEVLPERQPFPYSFKRLFIWAQKGG